jgi:ribosome maturation factor RimP
MSRKEVVVMSKYSGIRRALKLAKKTGQSVNVGLNRGQEAQKIEGVIKKVEDDEFRILLESGLRETVPIEEVEYVEYS